MALCLYITWLSAARERSSLRLSGVVFEVVVRRSERANARGGHGRDPEMTYALSFLCAPTQNSERSLWYRTYLTLAIEQLLRPQPSKYLMHQQKGYHTKFSESVGG